MVAVDATLQTLQPDTTLAPLKVGADATSPTAVALPTLDAVARATLASILAELGQKLETGGEVSLSAGSLAALESITVSGTVAVSNYPASQPVSGTVALDAPTLAALETINAIVSGTVSVGNFPAFQAVTGPITDTQLRATPVPVSFPADESGLTDTQLRAAAVAVSATDLDIRNLALTDRVTNVDAAEDATLIWQTISFNTAGAQTIVVVGAAQRLRLRRFLLTGASVPDAAGDPVLTLTLGGKSLRATLLIGRFDILGDADQDLVITSSKSGQIDGTVGYTLEGA